MTFIVLKYSLKQQHLWIWEQSPYCGPHKPLQGLPGLYIPNEKILLKLHHFILVVTRVSSSLEQSFFWRGRGIIGLHMDASYHILH